MSNEFPFSTARSSLLNTETFRNLLGNALENSTQSVVILSAYVKAIGVKWLKEKIGEKDIKCTIVARWDKGDLAQGSSDLECYSLAKENGWTFKVLKDLHAKVMLVDNSILFIGSSNLTSHGMSFVAIPNKEMGIKVEAVEQDLKTINQLIDDATLVDDEFVEVLEEWKKNLPKIEKTKIPDFPKIIDKKFKEKFNQLWVNNFPWSDADDFLKYSEKKEDNIIHDLELFGLKDVKKTDLEKELKESFLQSKIFNWLIEKLETEENKEIYFGRLSSIIHNSLVDDPKPYRQNVKELQSNLYSYIKYFKPSNLDHSIPKTRSERIKLI